MCVYVCVFVRRVHVNVYGRQYIMGVHVRKYDYLYSILRSDTKVAGTYGGDNKLRLLFIGYRA